MPKRPKGEQRVADGSATPWRWCGSRRRGTGRKDWWRQGQSCRKSWRACWKGTGSGNEFKV